MNRLFATAAAALITSIGLFATPRPATAQTAQQIEMFRNLPADQQKAIMDQLGVGGGAAAAAGSKAPTFPTTVLPRRTDEPEEALALNPDGTPREPRARAGDSLLITLKLKEFEEKVDLSERTARRERNESRERERVGVQQEAEDAPQKPPMLREAIDRDEESQKALEAYVARVARGNPYKLDALGRLALPELELIGIAGLTAEQVKRRLAADPSLLDYDVDVVLLSPDRVGDDALKPFGYDLFAGITTTFAPATDVPVPAEYVLGPGDVLEVQLLGKDSRRFTAAVDRDGAIAFPELGPIRVAGMRFEDARAMLQDRVETQLIGVRASITMGELRSIRVFILGDVEQPGSYTVSGLSTITNALLVSGGVKPIGSLRRIELKRAGRTVQRLDLYDLLLRGDTRDDARLQPGDVIFIPPVGDTVTVAGAVRRPAIYEVNGERTAAELVALAGGLMPEADGSQATLERIAANRNRSVVGVDLDAAGTATAVQNGDLLRVPAVRPLLDGAVTLSGHVYRPGKFEFRNGMRLSDVLRSYDELKPDADQRYVLIRREDPRTRRVTAISEDLRRALSARGSPDDPALSARDQITVFDTAGGRARIVEPLVEELRRQATSDSPSPIVGVGGRVKAGGQYPLEPGMRVSDLIRAGGGLDEAAFQREAELTRYVVVDGETRRTELVPLDLTAILAGVGDSDVLLQPYDYVVIKELPEWAEQEQVTIRGEVRFPGVYPIKRGETLRSVLQRAGGLTSLAFTEGSVFVRKELKEREQKQLQVLADRLQRDLATLAVQTTNSQPMAAAGATQVSLVGESLLDDLRETKAVGRLVIDLDRVLAAKPGSDDDILLRDGDALTVPKFSQEVTVIGEIQTSTSHLWRDGASLEEYIAQSGGYSAQADKKRIYVIRANGSVVANNGSLWFDGGASTIRPGDTIVVPLDAIRMRPLPLWTSVTQIIYNLAIAAAAVNSF